MAAPLILPEHGDLPLRTLSWKDGQASGLGLMGGKGRFTRAEEAFSIGTGMVEMRDHFLLYPEAMCKGTF